MKNDIAKDRHIIDTPLNRPKKKPAELQSQFCFFKIHENLLSFL